MQSTFPTHLILLLITLTKQYNTRISSSHNPLYPPVTSSLLYPNIPLSTLFRHPTVPLLLQVSSMISPVFWRHSFVTCWCTVHCASCPPRPLPKHFPLDWHWTNRFPHCPWGDVAKYALCTFERSKAECGRHVALCADTRWPQHEASSQPNVQFVPVVRPNVPLKQNGRYTYRLL